MAKKLSVTPRGTLVFPWLQKPDFKYKKETGEYHTGLRMKADDEKAVSLMERIDKMMEEAVQEALKEAPTPKARKKVKMCKDRPYRVETDDDDEPTGYVVFNFKMAAQVKGKDGEPIKLKPALFDNSGEPLDKDTRVGSGTTAKVSYEAVTFYNLQIGAGVSLRLYAVQVIALVEWGSGDSEYYGFEDESDDDDADETEEQQTDEDADDEDADDEDADDEDAEEEDEEEDADEEDEPAEKPAAKAKKGKTSKDDDF